MGRSRCPGGLESGNNTLIQKGNNKECHNQYRGTTLLSVVSNVYERIVEQTLRKMIKIQLEQSQCGFRKRTSIQDQLQILKQIIEKDTPRTNKHILHSST